MTSNDRRVTRDPLGLGGRTLLDRYVVEGAIAKGGMAIIYRGSDRRLLRPVCIKVFHRLSANELGYKTAYEHFVQEAFALSQFSHPNTLRIYDFGYIDDESQAPFQISELLDGGTLGQLVRGEGPVAPADALEILEPVAGALAEAHARGIVHRDIKPSNILFGTAGARRIVKLCDFGIAKIAEDADAPNRAEDTFASNGKKLRLYSPGWCAPEQLRGEVVGPGADVFALGLVTAFLLTGQTVFPGTLDADAIAMRSESDRHLDRFLDASKLPPPVADVIRRACRDQVDQRFGSVDAFVAALRGAVKSLPRDPERLETEPFPAVAAAPAEPVVVGTGVTLPLAAPAVSALPPIAGEHKPALALDPRGDDEVVVAGRRMKLVPIGGAEQVDLGGDAPFLRSPARFRITRQPSSGALPRINVKGLNCFVAVVRGAREVRPTTAVDLEGDGDVQLVAPDRRVLDGLRCLLGRPRDADRLYDLGSVVLAVPAAAGAVLLDLGPGRELALLHRGAPAAGKDRSTRRR